MREQDVEINYKPRDIFKPYHNRTQRFTVGVAHRRSGKTVAAINDQIKRAIQSPKERYRAGYIAPFRGQAKDVAWEYLKLYSRPLWGDYDPNESELYVRILNGARIKLFGADNEDALRGPYLDDVVMDEYADMSPTLFGAIIRPMLADRQGSATFIGTPKGRNDFYKKLLKAQSEDDWHWFLLRASETKIIPEKELAEARRDMTPEEYAGEFECSFDAAIVGAYYGKEMTAALAEGRIVNDLAVLPGPMHTAWDFGNGLNMAVWVFQVGEKGPIIHDFIQMSGAYFNDYLLEVTERGYNGFDYVPQDAKVPSFETGRTRIETMLEHKRNPVLVAAHRVEDGINAVKLMLPLARLNADKCQSGIEALRQYRQDWDEKGKVFRNSPRHNWASHGADAVRTMAMAWREMKAAVPPITTKPLIKIEEMTMTQWVGQTIGGRRRDRV